MPPASIPPRLRDALEAHFLVASPARAVARHRAADAALVGLLARPSRRAAARRIPEAGFAAPLERAALAWVGEGGEAEVQVRAFLLTRLVDGWRRLVEDRERLAGHLLIVHGQRDLRDLRMPALVRLHARLHREARRRAGTAAVS